MPAGGDEEEVGKVAADAVEQVGEVAAGAAGAADDDEDNEILLTKSQKNKKRSSSSSRMTVTRHPVDKKAKTKASPGTTSKTSRTTTSKKSKTPKKAEKWSDGEELSDESCSVRRSSSSSTRNTQIQSAWISDNALPV